MDTTPGCARAGCAWRRRCRCRGRRRGAIRRAIRSFGRGSSGSFLCANEVAYAGGVFVGLSFDRLFELMTKIHELALVAGVGRRMRRDFADVPPRAMNPLEQRFEGRLKDFIVVRTSQPAP